MRNKATLEQSAVIRGGKLTGFFRQISCLGSANKGGSYKLAQFS